MFVSVDEANVNKSQFILWVADLWLKLFARFQLSKCFNFLVILFIIHSL